MSILNDTSDCRLETVLALAAAFPTTTYATEIARRREMSEKFLTRLLSRLARAGVIVTTRGPNDGACLT